MVPKVVPMLVRAGFGVVVPNVVPTLGWVGPMIPQKWFPVVPGVVPASYPQGLPIGAVPRDRTWLSRMDTERVSSDAWTAGPSSTAHRHLLVVSAYSVLPM